MGKLAAVVVCGVARFENGSDRPRDWSPTRAEPGGRTPPVSLQK